MSQVSKPRGGLVIIMQKEATALFPAAPKA